MDNYIIILLVIVLILNILILVFNVAIASFLVNGMNSLNNKLNYIIQEPPMVSLKNTRKIPDDDNDGLMDIQTVQTYDPKFIDSKYVEN